MPPAEPSDDSAAATNELHERLAAAEAEAAAARQLRESLEFAEAEAVLLRSRLEATAVEADSTAAQLRHDAARMEAAQSELGEQLAAATSTGEVSAQSLCRLQRRRAEVHCRRARFWEALAARRVGRRVASA